MSDIEFVLQRLDALEKRNGELAQAVRDLRDAATVTAAIQQRQAEIQRRQAEIQEGQAEIQEGQAERLQELEKSRQQHEKMMAHIDMRLAEATDKLDGLIGFMEDFFRRQSGRQE